MPSNSAVASRLVLPAAEVVLQAIATPLGGLSLAGASDAQVALTLTASLGTLSAGTFPGATVSGSGGFSLWIAGSLADVNAKLATLVYAAPTIGTDTLRISLVDGSGQSAGPASLPVEIIPLITTSGTPNPTVTIPGGTLTLSERTLDGIDLAIHDAQTGAGASTVILVDTTLGANTALDIASANPLAPSPRLAIAGQVALNGATSLDSGRALVTLAQTATLTNSGRITLHGSSATFTGGGTLRNDGTIAIAAASTPDLEVAITGTGVISIATNATVTIGAPVAATETLAFQDSTGTLVLGAPETMQATIANFMPGDQIQLGELPMDAADYTAAANGGTLTLFDGAQIAATLHFSGAHQLGDFKFSVATDTAADGGAITTLSILASPSLDAVTASTEIYRFFDNATGTQLLTQDPAERDFVLATRSDLTFEGVAMRGVAADDPAATPVYRFFDVANGTHFFTASAAERNALLTSRPDLVFEPGSTIFEHATQQPGDAPVFRFFDSATGTHFDTASAAERASILATRHDLVPEGIAFYAPGR